ncbi:MAG: response regulator transcription factor [Sideroxyarcus sp.]|nr:response regulator transcription factor [Sideroxyarcus sp.]
MSSTGTPTPAIKVLIVDDHPVVREGMRALFGRHPEFHVIAEAVDGIEAVSLYPSLLPDVSLIDLHLPGLNGIEVIRAIRKHHPDAGLVAITSWAGDANVRSAFAAGADGFLHKGVPGEEVLEAVRTVHAGGRWMSSETMALLDATHGYDLTLREVGVITLVAEGLRNQEIANQLGLSLSTVKVHINAIMEKLNAQDRTEAVVTALKRGIIHL